MENVEREIIEKAVSTNFELRRLYSQHRKYESELDKLGRQIYLTPQEEVNQKRLKQDKLRGVEQMMRIIGLPKVAVNQ